MWYRVVISSKTSYVRVVVQVEIHWNSKVSLKRVVRCIIICKDYDKETTKGNK